MQTAPETVRVPLHTRELVATRRALSNCCPGLPQPLSLKQVPVVNALLGRVGRRVGTPARVRVSVVVIPVYACRRRRTSLDFHGHS